jgi:hypothetical protein
VSSALSPGGEVVLFRRQSLTTRWSRHPGRLGQYDREEYEEHRAVLEATLPFPPVARFVMMNRNRLDVRDVNGEWPWRHRNRSRVERELALGSHPATVHLVAELFFDGRSSSTRTAVARTTRAHVFF